jgi:CheY-like chemotaxis protein
MTDSSHKKTLLIVDDIAININLLEGVLAPEYHIRTATSGLAALEIANTQPIDLILLDVMMPEMGGHEACQRLKGNPATRDIPIIFVTAMTADNDELKGLEFGAVDYITKPINLPILRARVRTQLALRQARKELAYKNLLLEEERRVVEEVVVKMRTDHHFDQRHLRTLISPVEKTSGDLILSAFHPDGRQHLLVGDFTGHGLPAAIGGPLVSYLFYAMTSRGCSASEILAEINAVTYRQLPTSQFMATALVEVSPDRSRLILWNAALPACLLVRGDGSTRHYSSRLMPLGITGTLESGEREEIDLHASDRLYIFSDGLMEATNSTGEMFGYPRLEKLLIECAVQDRPLESVLEQVNAFRAAGEQVDDFTLIELSP